MPKIPTFKLPKSSEMISKFKEIIRSSVIIFTSREFAFLYSVFGVITQVAHTYYLTYSVSSFEGGFKIFQAILLSLFISSSLLYFVAVVDNSDTVENKRNKLAVTVFMWIEILINLYYYSRHLLIDSKEIQIFDFIFAAMVSALIPVTIKLYASTIRAKEWFEEIMNQQTVNTNQQNIDAQIINLIVSTIDNKISLIKSDIHHLVNNSINKNELQSLVDLKISELKDQFINNIDNDVASIFSRNQELFLNQFENKVNLLITEKQNSLNATTI